MINFTEIYQKHGRCNIYTDSAGNGVALVDSRLVYRIASGSPTGDLLGEVVTERTDGKTIWLRWEAEDGSIEDCCSPRYRAFGILYRGQVFEW